MPRLRAACIGVLTGALWRRLCARQGTGRAASGSLRVPGLDRDVWICRDDAGVPQIYAETEQDLAFGLGLALAQDRLWQMETLRHLAGGRLGELLGDRPLGGRSLHLPGATTLALDRFYRSLRMQAVAREERSRMGRDAATVLDGFVKGVNAWLDRCHPRDLPPECLLVGIRPGPWTPEDSLAIGKLIGWLLSLAFPAKPILAALAGNPALRPILPPDLATGRSILGGGFPTRTASLDLLARQALGLAGPGVGSNGWVVSGARTASGKPLLCNDPHLLFGLPPFWYPVALHGPSHRVIGGTLPGVPGVLIGRNEHLAWGFTAVMADDGDYYRERLDASGERYLRDGTWSPIEVMEEDFRVKGRTGALCQRLRYVRHGGVLCPLLPEEEGAPPTSFRWVGLEPWRSLEAVLGMNRARTVKEFEAAVQEFAVPAQNVVVADREGDIAYFCAGKFPRRPWARQEDDILEGASPAHAWQGYLSWDELPSAMNPQEGFLATANNRVAAELPPTLARGFWEPPYRALRITQLLSECGRADVEDMARIQTDSLSLQAAGLVARLVRPLAATLHAPGARQAAALLLEWDSRLTADSAPAALYHLFYQALLTRCFQPALEQQVPGLFGRYFSLLHLAVAAADGALMQADQRWFPGGVGAAVEACLSAAWEQAMTRLGPDPAGWRWGTLHTLTFFHGIGRAGGWAIRGLDWLFGLNRGPYARPGDGMTVNLGAFPLTEPFAVMAGPSYRHIVDLGDPEASRWIIAGGTSGDPRSPHYADQIEPWLRGAYRPMRLRARTEASEGAVLRLRPVASSDCVSSAGVL